MGEKIKFGVIGTGMIAKIFSDALNMVEDAESYAIASRSSEKASSFAKEYGFVKSYGSYEEMISDKDVDVVYIGSPHSHHHEHAMLALNAGKHVLCEKAFTVNAKEAKELIETARSKNLFLMEAMWIRYLPHVRQMMDWIDAGRIGDVLSISSVFGNGVAKKFDSNHRLFKKNLAGGAVLDLGIYPYSMISMIFKEQPKKILASAEFNECTTDNTCNTIFEFSKKRSAIATVSFDFKKMFSATILGTKGYIDVNGFWWTGNPIILHVENEKDEILEYNADNNPLGYSYEIQEVVNCLKNGNTESELMKLDETLELMRTMDEIRRQIGLVYPADEM